MTILVTGSDGLVGSALRELISENVYFATRKDADLTNYQETESLFNRIKPEKVIHLAALVGGIGGNLMHSGEYFRDNLQININTLEAARKTNVSKLVSFMSTCVFPNEGPYPLTPETLHLGQPHPSNFGYAYAKRMLEVQSRAYRAQWGLDYVVAIPTNIFGPRDNFNLIEGHVVPALIHKTYLAKKEKTNLTVWGSGKPLREFVFSKDVAKITLWMLNNYSDSEPLILTSGTETSIRDLVECVVREMDFSGEINFDKTKPDGQFRKPSSNEALLERLPNFSFTKLSDGVKETVEWFNGNYPSIRK
ncbi:GDP-L-fucose synthase [Actinobacteria bacterium IMCC26103]|nr:GDP-L-fucose synthase [Actinobacteria bacterium IMCC26103]